MLEIKGLTANYGHITALQDISLDMGENEIVALIGSNGRQNYLVNSISGLVTKPEKFTITERIFPLKRPGCGKIGILQVPEGRHVFLA